MKNNGLFLSAIVITVLSLFNSCKKESSSSIKTQSYVPPTISLTNLSAKDSVYSGESCTISGVAGTTGKLRMIQFFRSFPYNGGESEVEVANARITKFSVDSTANFAVVIINIKNATKFSVKVTDENGQATSAVVSISLRKSNIYSYPGCMLGGWDSNYGSCLDVDTGIAYGGSAVENPTLRPLVDVFFDDSKLGNVDLDSMYYGYNRLSDSGIRYAKTTFTSASFDAMKVDDYFKDLVATLPIITIKLNDVVFFKAKSGKKGLLRVSVLTFPTGDLVLDEKIQK